MTSYAFHSSPSTCCEMKGDLRSMLDGLTEQWLLVAPLANPAMLEIFADRDNPPYRNMMPWAGEFAGKYLTSAVQVWQVTGDARLRSWLADFVRRLVDLQAEDGYLGPWPADCRLKNFSPYHGEKGLQTWDTWGHYHIMTGLLLWYESAADQAALQCACRIADLICARYAGPRETRLVDTGMTEMNLAPAHALARLYRITGSQPYLQMAEQIVEEWGAANAEGPLAGDYLRLALAGKALFEMPRPRWEGLHTILALPELYRATGRAEYRQAFENLWWGIVENDRHNNGGFSSGEQATGTPYHQGMIETCCTIAWMVMTAEMLQLTGNSIAADELELSTYNSVMGMHSPAGRWATYNTPMDGARFASAHAIVFQARSGSPELNCCSVNSPRGLGLLSEWGLLLAGGDLVVNYYGPGLASTTMSDGLAVELRQETDYPLSGTIRLQVNPSHPARFGLKLRIPYWSRHTRVRLNHEPAAAPAPGQYYEIRREWQAGDTVEIDLDMSLHFWRGEKECAGLVSVFRGPLVLAYDQRFNPGFAALQKAARIPDNCWEVSRDLLAAPELDARQLDVRQVARPDWHAPLLLLETVTASGETVRLCDFASAGKTGCLYRSWLPVRNAPEPQPFTRSNPLRSGR